MMDGSFLESLPASGGKRSVKDRLGSNVDYLMYENPQKNKRCVFSFHWTFFFIMFNCCLLFFLSLFSHFLKDIIAAF